MTPPSVPDHPLLLVHGYMDTVGSPWWPRFRQRLAARGYGDRVVLLDQGRVPMTTVGSPKDYASRILEAVRTLADCTDGDVDVLAHSMGGLSARWCIERLDGDRYVDDLITLGTPHHGTSLAYLGVATPGGRAMIPGSDFLATLNEGSLADSVDYTAVWSDGDGMIDPVDSAALDADWFPSMFGAQNVKLDGISHMGYVADDELIDQYLEYLD